MTESTDNPTAQSVSNRLVRYRLLCDWQAYAEAGQAGDTRREYNLLVRIAATYAQQGLFARSVATFEQALAITQRIGNRLFQGGILCALGDVYIAWGRGELAMQQYQEALAIAEQLDNPQLKRVCFMGLKKVESAVLLDRLHALQHTPAPTVIPDMPDLHPEHRELQRLLRWRRRARLLMAFVLLVGVPALLAEARAPLLVQAAALLTSCGLLLALFERLAAPRQ